ncbi:DUF3093 domain-containing protein [Micromonospora polyrhachis]|uniref:DUF3093 domain-containing protein n=1 Tax=Micromonospora polyrhachis TaxID=1282883 RepID=A0A7W7WMY3_9ACTN|nr:hypothetical protein [Micromonospora polyrhachis]
MVVSILPGTTVPPRRTLDRVTPSRSQSTAVSTAPATHGYAERLRLPWWAWLLGIGFAAFMAVEIWMGAPGMRAWLPFAILLPLTGIGLWWLGRIRVAVQDGEFLVDDARLPVRFVADAIALDANGRREVLGVGADPLAFVVQRPWVPGAVQVVLDDPADPTPYWVVSSRNPVRLATAILAARDAA